MKRYLPLVILLLSFLVLIGCSTTHLSSYANSDLATESWMQAVDYDTDNWLRGVDSWYASNGTNGGSGEDMGPVPPGMSTTQVTVPNFTAVKIDGDFTVQMFGTAGENSLSIVGPSDGVRKVIVEIQGGILCISQVQEKQPYPMGNVTVRIGVTQLNSLVHNGCGLLEGVHLNSEHLIVSQSGTGNMFLSGYLNVNKIFNNSAGIITIMGAATPWLDINTTGTGPTNVAGHVGVRHIIHTNVNDINIIGADSESLQIDADGGGKVSILGNVNLREVRARSAAEVFVIGVNSPMLYAYANDNARVGLKGNAVNLYVQTGQNAMFFGRYLCTDSTFARASSNSHINVTARLRMFGSATENASIYFYGSPGIMSQFVSGNGLVLPLWVEGAPNCAAPPMPVDYKGEGYVPLKRDYKGEG